jgi:hypothetical protein
VLAGVITVVPAVLAVGGLDLLAARNVLPGVVFAAILVAAGGVATRLGTAALAALAALSIAIVVANDTDPSLQRADWRGVARAIGDSGPPRALIMTPGKAQGPFQVYLPSARTLASEGIETSEILVAAVATQGGFTTGSPRPPRPPAEPVVPSGFRLESRRDEQTFTLLRYVAPTPVLVRPIDLVPLALDPSAGAAAWALG